MLFSILVMFVLTITQLKSQYNYLCDYETKFTGNTIGSWLSATCSVTQTQSTASGAVTWLGFNPTTLLWTEQTVEAVINIISGSGSWVSAGIIFRGTSIANIGDAGDYYWVAIFISGLQSYSIALITLDSFTVLQSDNSQTIAYNTNYTVKAVASGDSIVIYLDGLFIFAYNDNSFSAGSVGLRTFDSSAIYTLLSIQLPTNNPTISPTNIPTSITSSPTSIPTNIPTISPTNNPLIYLYLHFIAEFEIDENVDENEIEKVVTNALIAYSIVKIVSTKIDRIGNVVIEIKSNDNQLDEDTIKKQIEEELKNQYNKYIVVSVQRLNDIIENETEPEKSSLTLASIYLCVIIGSVLIVISCIIALCYLYKKKKKSLQETVEQQIEMTTTGEDEQHKKSFQTENNLVDEGNVIDEGNVVDEGNVIIHHVHVINTRKNTLKETDYL